MTERLLTVDREPRPGCSHRHLKWGETDLTPCGVTSGVADAIAAELDRLYAAAEANQAPGPAWKAKLREEVEGLKRRAKESTEAAWVLVDVLALIDALPDPPTPDPDAPPVYVPPEGHVAPVRGEDVPDGWEGHYVCESGYWWDARTCRAEPNVLFEVRRVPDPEPATEWVPLTKLVGRTIDGCDKPCDGHPTYDDVFDNWMWRNGPSWMIIPRNKLNPDTAQVLVLAEGERS